MKTLGYDFCHVPCRTHDFISLNRASLLGPLRRNLVTCAPQKGKIGMSQNATEGECRECHDGPEHEGARSGLGRDHIPSERHCRHQ